MASEAGHPGRHRGPGSGHQRQRRLGSRRTIIATDTTDARTATTCFTGLPLDDGDGDADYLVVGRPTPTTCWDGLTQTDDPSDGAEAWSATMPALSASALDAGTARRTWTRTSATRRGPRAAARASSATPSGSTPIRRRRAYNPDAGDPPIEGVVGGARRRDGNVIATTTTDENGNYYFGGLDPDTWTTPSRSQPATSLPAACWKASTTRRIPMAATTARRIRR